MDTATQALLGAVVGQATFSHRLGGRALAFGAVAGLLPDLDVVAVVTHGPFGEFVHHRGFTHALWFGPVAGPIFGWAVWRYYRWRGRTGPGEPGAQSLLPAWMGLFVLAILTHPLIDIFTTYGTQLLAPFSRHRTALDAVAIIDITYSSLLLLSLLIGFALRKRPDARRLVAWAGLFLSWGYMGYGWWLNEDAERTLRAEFAARGHPEAIVNTYPTLILPYLRRAVVRTDDRIWVGLYTPLGGGASTFESFPQPPPHPLVDRVRATPEGRIFEWFAMGETQAHLIPRGQEISVEIDDLRYGFPGDSERGMWGIRADFDRNGNLVGPVRRTRDNRPRTLSLDAFWRATWGEPSALFATPAGP